MQRRKAGSEFLVSNGAVFGACILLLALTFALTVKTAVQPGLLNPESDFCDYTSKYFKEPRHTYKYDAGEQHPVIDHYNKLYICVASKCGVTKLQMSYHSYVRRKHPEATPRTMYAFLGEAQQRFRKDFGEFDVSLAGSNYTKIFVYRNPMSRTISLWNDKFQRPNQLCMTSRNMLERYRVFRIEILLERLYEWVMLFRDRHLYPQMELCQVETSDYDIMVDIDDHEQLTNIFGSIWGEDIINFEQGTYHETKTKFTDAYRAELRQKIELWREAYTGVYWQDIDFYCKQQGNKENPMRQM